MGNWQTVVKICPLIATFPILQTRNTPRSKQKKERARKTKAKRKQETIK